MRRMNLSPGDRLGPYELVAVTGEGGMGTVWKARDPRLDRTVAVKVSRDAFTERFDREARAVAALNHPNICQLYDVGPDYLVMEFVDGQPLKGPLPLPKAVEYASQILDALEAAHKKGITHRDLKPANILVTRQGIKLLDFGLAKRAAASGLEDATMTAITTEGQIAGTLQYMSPEQLQGKEVDARSDLFSFGCVLYEMLSGERSFKGDSTASVIAAILEREPAKLELGPPLERVLRTALAKDPDRRFQSAIDLKRNLLWAVEERLLLAPAAAPRFPAWAVAIPLVLAAALAWALWRTPAKTATPPSAIKRLTRDGRSWAPALSPDGKLLAFASSRASPNPGIYVQQSGSAPIRLTDDPAGDSGPAFSADGSKIYFTSSRTPPGIYEIPALGGDARLVIPDASRPRPSPRGTHLVYLDRAGGWLADTLPQSKAVALAVSGTDWSFYGPVWSPDGSRLLIRGTVDFQIVSPTGEPLQSVPLAGNIVGRRIGQPAALSVVAWLPNDDLLFRNSFGDATNLWRIPLRQAGDGIPSAVTSGAFTNLRGAAATANRVVFSASTSTLSLWSLPCDLDTGKVTGPLVQATPASVDASHPDITPDGRQLVYCSRRNGPQSIWTMDLRTGKDRLLAAMNRLGDDYSHTVISPDGKLVAAMVQEPQRIVLLNAAGGPARTLLSEGARLRGFTPDSRGLLISPIAGEQVFLLDAATGARTRIVSRGSEVFHEPRLSADGQWLAFVRTDGTLYIAPFRGNQAIPPAEWIEVASPVSQPAWSPDGQSIYFRPIDPVGGGEPVLMRQVLDRAAKRLAGPATVFARFGGMYFASAIVNPIAVTRNRIVLTLSEPASDLWSIDLPAP